MFDYQRAWEQFSNNVVGSYRLRIALSQKYICGIPEI